MGVITISLDDAIEEKLRKIAVARFRKKKGYLAKAISEALNEWASKMEQESMSKAISILLDGVNLGGIVSKKREDLHKR
ncbi:hypothetical protein FJZ21_00825 [Candidatus Pacearchaeota archaeon]|nr:hypothetical protein [Candidatus Pacearchaeota archaeon]